MQLAGRATRGEGGHTADLGVYLWGPGPGGRAGRWGERWVSSQGPVLRSCPGPRRTPMSKQLSPASSVTSPSMPQR